MKLKVNDLSKRFGNETALESFSNEFVHGNVFGISGKNGSGKTTLLKIISNFLFQSKGEIIFSEEIKQHEIAYIDNNARSFFMRLSCIENLYYFASLNYIERCEVDKLLYNDFDDWGLDEFIFKKVNEISLGQSQCLKIIMAHLKSPKVYLYDEVFSSLDDNKKLKLKNFVQKIKKNNCIQIITSHDKKVLKEFADVEIFL